jgi:hypothetical protein
METIADEGIAVVFCVQKIKPAHWKSLMEYVDRKEVSLIPNVRRH